MANYAVPEKDKQTAAEVLMELWNEEIKQLVFWKGWEYNADLNLVSLSRRIYFLPVIFVYLTDLYGWILQRQFI